MITPNLLVLSSFLVACGGDSDGNSKDNIKSVTKLLALGESLTLAHSLSKASASAEYVAYNTVFPVSNYPATHSPKVGDAVADFSSNGRLSSHDSFLLSNGNYALVNYENFMIANPQGEEQLAMSSPDADGKDACNMHGAAVKDIGFVLAHTLCNEDQKNLIA